MYIALDRGSTLDVRLKGPASRAARAPQRSPARLPTQARPFRFRRGREFFFFWRFGQQATRLTLFIFDRRGDVGGGETREKKESSYEELGCFKIKQMVERDTCSACRLLSLSVSSACLLCDYCVLRIAYCFYLWSRAHVIQAFMYYACAKSA